MSCLGRSRTASTSPTLPPSPTPIGCGRRCRSRSSSTPAARSVPPNRRCGRCSGFSPTDPPSSCSTTASTFSTQPATRWSRSSMRRNESPCWPRAVRGSTSRASGWSRCHHSRSEPTRYACFTTELQPPVPWLSTTRWRGGSASVSTVSPSPSSWRPARCAQIGAAEVDERLSDRFRLLTGSRRRIPRQRTLEATLDWSFDLLDAAEQAVMRRLSVFSGSFTLAAAEAVAQADLQLLSALVDKSLVQRTVDERFRLLETVRAYGEQRLADAARLNQRANASSTGCSQRSRPSATKRWCSGRRPPTASSGPSWRTCTPPWPGQSTGTAGLTWPGSRRTSL